MAATISRNADETDAPTSAPSDESAGRCALTNTAPTAIASVSATTTVEWPSEKNSPTPSGRRPLLHELARDVVDRADVIGIDGVAQPEGEGEQRRAEQHGMRPKYGGRKRPRGAVEREQRRDQG